MKHTPLSQSKKYPAWHLVEKKINEEMNWLKNSVDTFSDKESYFPNVCQKCLMREIAILIVSGKIKAKEIRKKHQLVKFWRGKPKKKQTPMRHGQDWHRQKNEGNRRSFSFQGF